MQFLCEFFIAEAFKLFFIVHLLFTFSSVQVRCLLSLSYTASFLLPWGKVLGLDLKGDRYTQVTDFPLRSFPGYLPFCLQSEGCGWREIRGPIFLH